MQEIRFCLVGAGRAGMVHALNFQSHIKHTLVVGVVDVNESVGREAANKLGISSVYTSLDEAFKSVDFDAVCIGAPTFAHAEIAIQAAKNGKHVLCEKPLALTIEEADHMASAVKNNGVICQVDFMRRYDENFIKAKQLLLKGAIGEPVLVKSLGRGPGLPPGEWFYDLKKSNGLLAEVNSHDFDTIRWFTGSDIAEVYAIAGNYRCQNIRSKYPDFYDTVAVNLKLENGTLAMVDGCCPAVYGFEARVEILGTNGMIQLGSQNASSVLTWGRTNELIAEGNRSWRTLFKDAYLRADKDFVDCIIHGREPQVTIEDGKKAIEVVIAGNESLKRGCPIQI